MTKFVALYDLHYGQDIKDGKRKELHDIRALEVVKKFMSDFKPDAVILGGDMLDCGSISHHNKGKVRNVEGLRLLSDMQGLRKELLDELEASKTQRLVYIVGNHEHWIEQLVDECPGVEGLISLESGLGLRHPRWEIIEQGGVTNIGKVHFLHGDQIRSSAYPAKWAVDTYEKSVRFGHFHRAQLHSKISALDVTDIRTGISVPALCRRDTAYGKGAPNQWSQGFLWGYVMEDGNFSDYLTFIVNGKFVANGKVYKA